MVELKTKMTASGMVYIPKEIRDSFGATLKIVPDARAAVMFPENAEYQDVLDSLDIIASDIRHRIRLAQRETSNG